MLRSQVEVEINIGMREYVCTMSRPLSLPIVCTWTNRNSTGREFACLLDSADVLWTNCSRGSNDDVNVFRRVTWRETLNLVQHFHPDILGEVIDAAGDLQPHLLEMMRKYAEFGGNDVIQSRLPREEPRCQPTARSS